jgi:FkbM family methyltransferase
VTRLYGEIATLPNGLRVMCQSRAELRHFYDDIFEKEVYAKNGIHLGADSCVLDVGANVGLYSLFVQERFPDARVYAFEPAPILYRLLRQNTARYGRRVRCFNLGLSDHPGEAVLTFYPKSSGMSSFHPDEAEERRNLTAVLENEARQGVEEVEKLMPYLDEYLAVRLQAEEVRCRLSTVSAFLREQDLERVDLIKIDVQKSEAEIVRGIDDRDWPRIRQLVIEVHDADGRVAEFKALLKSHGFRVTVEQDELYAGSDVFNLYAIRDGS